MNPYSEKCKNGIRVALIIIDVVRERLDLTLNEVIKQNNFKDLNDFLVNKKSVLIKSRLYPEQQEKLYPKNQQNPTNSSKEFDCTLCLNLLKKLKLMSSIEENIKLLVKIRNHNFGHIASMELENNELRRLSEFKTDIFDNVYDKGAYENNYSIVARIEFSIYGLCFTNNEKVNFEKKISNYLTMRIEDINAEQFMDIKRQLEELMNINNEMVRNQLSDMETKLYSDFDSFHSSLKEIRDNCEGYTDSIRDQKNQLRNIKEGMDSANREQKNQLRNIKEGMDSANREQLKKLENFEAKFDESFDRIAPKLENIIREEHKCEKEKLDGLSQDMENLPIRITETLAKKEEEILHRIFLKFDDQTKCIEEQIQVNLKKLENIIPKKKTKHKDCIEEDCTEEGYIEEGMFDKLKDVLSGLINERKDELHGENSWAIDHQKAIKSLEEDILNKLDQLSKERINDTKNIQSKLDAIEINLVNIFSYILENIKNESSQERYLNDYENIVAKLDFSTDLIIQSVEAIYIDNQEIKELINSSKKHEDTREERYEDNRDLLKRLLEILKKIDLSQYENLMKQFSEINERTSNLFSLASLKLQDDDLEKMYKLINEQMDKMIVDLNERLKKDFLEVKLQKENEKLKSERKIMPVNQYMQLDINCNDKNELKIECYDNDKNPIKFSCLYFNKQEYRMITRYERKFSDEKERLNEKIPFNFSLSLTPDLKVSCIYFEGLSCDNKPKMGENFASKDMPKNDDMPSEEFAKRLERENAKSGQVSVSLIWNNENDLDLHVIDPNNEEIYYGHKKSVSGGELDVDMNANSESLSKTPIENIVWPWNKAPKGKYKVFVNYFAKHCNQNETNYKVSVYSDNTRKEFSGCIKKEDGKKLVHEFVH